MLDKMMRIAGRGSDGKAKALQTTNQGILKTTENTQLLNRKNTINFTAGELKTVFEDIPFSGKQVIIQIRHEVYNFFKSSNLKGEYIVRVVYKDEYENVTLVTNNLYEDVYAVRTSGSEVDNFGEIGRGGMWIFPFPHNGFIDIQIKDLTDTEHSIHTITVIGG